MNGIRNYWALALVGAVALTGCAEPYEEEDIGVDQEVGVSDDVADLESDAPLADAEYDYGEWDVDSNRTLSREEFGTWAGEQGWGEMDREAFATETTELWDADDDDLIGEDEWNEATDRFGDDIDVGTWSDWDGDGDSELDANEVREGLERSGIYDRIDGDADAVFDDEELADFWFDLWDADDDLEIDTTEWDWGSRAGFSEIGA